MRIKELSKKERDEASELLKHYKHVYCCGSCRRIYGTDADTDDKICPLCFKRLHKKED